MRGKMMPRGDRCSYMSSDTAMVRYLGGNRYRDATIKRTRPVALRLRIWRWWSMIPEVTGFKMSRNCVCSVSAEEIGGGASEHELVVIAGKVEY